MRTILLTAGFILLFVSEILSEYFILPFEDNYNHSFLDITYFFHSNIWWLRIVIFFVLIVYPVYCIFRYKKLWQKLLVSVVLVTYAGVFYYFNYYMLTEKIYQPMQVKKFASKNQNKINNDKMIIGVEINGVAKAYPLQIIGYHHHVTDTLNGRPIIITYCTMCRSARVYDAEVEGQIPGFKLVGLNRYNAVFKDNVTDSWWQQETGEAIAGPMKDSKLKKLPSHQVTLKSWVKKYPDGLIMQPDSNYLAAYYLDTDDRYFFKSKYHQLDSASFKAKSLVVGIVHDNVAKAYDFDKLNYSKIIEDSLSRLPVLLTLEPDNASFHAWNRNIKGYTLEFEKTSKPNAIKDINTQSLWNLEGTCIEGELQGTQLKEVQSYLETWQSWNDFHPESEAYEEE